MIQSQLALAPEIEAQRPERGYKLVEAAGEAIVLHHAYTLIFNLDRSTVRGEGLGIAKWLNTDTLPGSAALMAAHSPEPLSPVAALACAAHQQFAAWDGAQSIRGAL